MEGISFFNDGTLYGVTGDQAEAGANSDRLWLINPQTGQASSVLPGEIDNDGVAPHDLDYEGVSCLSAGSNLKSGFVFEDFNGNGVFDGSDVRRSGVAISFYRDNGNGSFDGGDTRVQTKVTDANGQYTFEVGTEGLYFAVLDQATLPVGSTLTTVGSFNVNFVNFDNSLTNNNFGFTTTIVETETPTPTPTIRRHPLDADHDARIHPALPGHPNCGLYPDTAAPIDSQQSERSGYHQGGPAVQRHSRRNGHVHDHRDEREPDGADRSCRVRHAG